MPGLCHLHSSYTIFSVDLVFHEMSGACNRCRLSWASMLFCLLVLVAGAVGEPRQLIIAHTWDGKEQVDKPAKLTLDAHHDGLLVTVEAKWDTPPDKFNFAPLSHFSIQVLERPGSPREAGRAVVSSLGLRSGRAVPAQRRRALLRG